MKSFLKLSFTATLLFFMMNVLQAQTSFSKESLKNSTPEQRATFLTDTMKTVLTLNDDQYSGIYNINLDLAKKTQSILQSDEGKMSKFKKIKALQDKRDSSYKKVLTEDQFDLYIKKKEDIMDMMKQRAQQRQNK